MIAAGPLAKRGMSVGRWVVPGAVLVLLPKCPVCLAAYIAMVSGLGLSLPVANFLRVALIILCAGSLLFLTLRRLHIPSSKNPKSTLS